MSQLDPVHEALERLEWQDSKREETPQTRLAAFTRRSALTGGAAGLVATHDRRLRRRRRQARDQLRTERHAGQRRLRRAGGAEVHARQPRDDEPVLRPDAVRRRGRVQAAGLQLSVDGLRERQRQRDGQRVQQRGQREVGRDRGLPRRPEGVQRPDREGARRRHPGRSATTPTRRTTGSPTSARTCSSPARRWASGSSSSSAGRVALFIATPGSLNIQPRIDGAIDAIKKSGKAITHAHGRHRRGAPEGAVDDRRLLARSQGHQGHVRRRRRQHPGASPRRSRSTGCATRA